MSDVLREFLISVGFAADETSARKAEAVAGRVERSVAGADKRVTDAQNIGSARRVLQANREAGIRTRGAAQIIAETKRIGEADDRHTKDAVTRGKDREQALQGVAQAHQGYSTGIIAGLAAITAAVGYAAVKFGSAIVQISAGMEQTFYSAGRVKTSAANLRAFGYAAGQMGSSAGEANASLESLAKNMRASPGYEKMLNDFGIATVQNGKLRDTVDVVQDLGDALAKMPTHVAKSYADALGIDERTLAALKGGEFKKYVAEYRSMLDKARLDPTKAASDSAAFMNTWRRMQNGLEIIGIRIQGTLVERFGGSVTKVTDWMLDNSDRISNGVIRIGETIMRLIGRVADLATEFGKLSPGTKDFIVQLGVMAGAIMFLKSGPLGAILMLGTALVTLYDDYKKWQEGSKDTLINWEKWGPGIEKAISFLTSDTGMIAAFTLLGLVLASKVLAPLTSVMTLLTGFGALRLPVWLLSLLGVGGGLAVAGGVAAAGVLAFGADHSKGVVHGGRPDINGNDLGLPGVDADGNGSAGPRRAPNDDRNLWQRVMPKALGGRDPGPTGAGADRKDGSGPRKAPSDDRSWYETVAPKALGGKDAPVASEAPQAPTKAPTVLGPAPAGLLDNIARAEGTAGKGDYNASLGYGRYLPEGKETVLTDKTLREIEELGRHMRRQPGNPNSSAMGRYQILGTSTMGAAAKALGMDMDTTKFDAATQDSMAHWIARKQGLGAWEGFKGHPVERATAARALSSDDQTSGTAAAPNAAPNIVSRATEAIPKIEGVLQRFDDRLGKVTGGAPMVMPDSAPLGASSVTNSTRTNNVSSPVSNTFNINGAADPRAVGAEVSKTQSRVHADLIRNMQGAVS